MPPEYESISSTCSLYVKNEDGTKTELKDFNVTIDIASDKDFTEYSLGKQSYEGSFTFKTINKNIFRQLTDNSYCKYLKRVKNRQKLYNKLRKLGR